MDIAISLDLGLERTLVLIGVILFAVLTGLIYLRMIHVYLSLKLRGATCIGQVTAYRSGTLKAGAAQDGEKAEETDYPVITFSVGSEQVSASPAYTTGGRLQIGDEVEVIYHPQKPTRFLVRSEVEGKRLWPGFLFMAVFLGVIFFLFYKF